MKNRNEWIFVMSFGVVISLLIGVSYYASSATSSLGEREKIPLYYASTRDLLNITYEPEKGPVGYRNETYRNFNELTEKTSCHQNETVVIFVHGWEEGEDNVKERLNRVKLSLENNSFIHPLVGFSWPSDTVWFGAKFIAAENGPKLANLITDVKNACPDTDIRLLAHSLGARVVLSSLDSLHKNQAWNGNNFTIKSTDLMGAAVDDEEISTNPQDILIDQTNWGTSKSDYGHAIESEVIDFTNSFSSKDNFLEPNPGKPYPPFQIYPSFETDRALGQSGYQKIPYSINLPKNYNDTNDVNVTNELVANCDADGDGDDDFSIPGTDICAIFEKGDNHRGYLGYRKPVNNLSIIDNGAIDIVVNRWTNETSTNTSPNIG